MTSSSPFALDLPRSRGQRTSLLLMALMFVTIGISHFTNTSYFVEIMPRALPSPHALVRVSGACEILGGVGLLSGVTRPFARWGLVLLLLAVFPANLQMALDSDRWAAFGIPPWALYARLPLQLVLIWWVVQATRTDEASSA